MLNPYPKKNKVIVPIFEYPIMESVSLLRVNKKNSLKIVECIVNRKSSRDLKFADPTQIGELLWHSAKVTGIDVEKDGYILSSRRAPSAGARHPIDIIVSQPKRENEERRCFSYYNPFEHSLNLLSLNYEISEKFFQHINEVVSINDATIIWFVAHPVRTSAKYDNFESLIWRDAGALIYCIQLVSTILGLKSCPIGSLGEPYISQLFKKNGAVFGVGGILIGS